jgi:hypothetical protein
VCTTGKEKKKSVRFLENRIKQGPVYGIIVDMD